MAQAQRKSSAMAREAGKQAGKAAPNPIVALEGKTDTATVRAARPAGLATGKNFTGQYLYDRFINNKADVKESLTKMDIVRSMVEVMAADKFGKIVGEMVMFAQTDVNAALRAAKEANPDYNPTQPTLAVREAQARLKTARNQQTVMRIAFGAMKFCAAELDKATNGQQIGFHMIRELGNKLLADKGINWDNTKAETQADRAGRAAQREETEAMLEIQKENPRKDDESRPEYYARMDTLVDKRMKERAEERRKDAIQKLVDKIKTMAGENLPDVIDQLLSGEPEEQVKEAAEVATAKADTNLH